jgi:undecaprenyl diphosphate synthase
MDGNGRWAQRRWLPRAAGHRQGVAVLTPLLEAAGRAGVKTLTLYAFSTENWTRPVDEVEDLMEIFGDTIERELPDLAKEGVRTRFVGRRDRAPASLLAQMETLEADTSDNDRLRLWICFDYGGRAELVDAARRIVASGVDPAAVDEELVAANLAEPEMPDPDLLIRTSGEQRISNFLLWQLAYAELVFTETLWPDFGADDLRAALDTFAGRRRRFGGR